MNNSLLSICIPTFKREKYLLENLSHIFKNKLSETVEIVIVDNNNDETNNMEIMIGELNKTNIRYFKNKENIGIDRNMIKVLEQARSRYCLWLGDDDIISDELIEGLLKELKEQPDLVLLNFSSISENLTIKKNNFIRIEEKIYNNLNSFFLKEVFNMPFGSIVVNKDFLHKVNYEKYIGTSHAYSGYIIEYISYISEKRNPIIYCSKNLKVYLRECKKTWSERSFIIHYEEIPKWFKLLPNEISQEIECKFREYLSEIFSMKILLQNMENLEKIKKLSLNYKVSFWRILKIKLILVLKKLKEIYEKQRNKYRLT